MVDLSALIDTVADPLVLVLGLLTLGALATHVFFRSYPLGRAIVRVVGLVTLTIALHRSGIVPYRPLELTGTPVRDLVHGTLKIAWWFWAAWFVVGFLRAFVIVERRPREGKLLQDLLAGLVYLAACFAIVSYVFNLPIQGLLATSGAIAIILGLALQSTLSDVFSGIVLNFSRPYRPGDWVTIDAATEGRVIEMNWRATHVLTGRLDLAIIPNSKIAKSTIVNASSPSGVHGIVTTIQLDPKAPPSMCTEILEHAILNCRSIMTTPSPTFLVKSINAAFTEFEITFFVSELANVTPARNELFDWIFRHLVVAGIGLASPQLQSLYSARVQRLRASTTQMDRMLDLVTIFSTLTSAERSAIATKLKPHSYEKGETLLENGDVAQSLFIVGTGVLSVARSEHGTTEELVRLGPGDHFGEIGMLTGTPSIAKINALTPVVVYEFPKAEVAPILAARPQVSQELCRALAQRQARARSIGTAEVDRTVPTNRLTSWFAERLNRLYDIASVDRSG